MFYVPKKEGVRKHLLILVVEAKQKANSVPDVATMGGIRYWPIG